MGKTKDERMDDPFPIVLPGETKPVPSNQVSKYINREFEHYYVFYTDFKVAGAPPYTTGWLDWPEWILQLVKAFDHVIEQVKSHYEKEAYRDWNK